MRENKYDDEVFFDKYAHMDRSQKGLAGAGEWHELQKLLPAFQGKRVLDLGCGFGWHCRYAVDQGAAAVVGIDLSAKMLARAKELTAPAQAERITYVRQPIEALDFDAGSFDVVLSSLVFHYIADFDSLCQTISQVLVPGGDFVFSCEHPIFTAYGTQDWYYDEQGQILHWPVDRYFDQGARNARFLGEEVVKYHRTLTGYIAPLFASGFTLAALVEPQPDETMLDSVPGMREELRRPMMLLLAAKKNR